MYKKIISITIIGLFLFSLMSFSSIAATSSSNAKDITQKLDTYMSALQKYQNFHGGVLVAKDGEILLQKGFGMADVENKIKNEKDTRFAIASVTKQFTAMAIMQLYEKGKLSLTDKLSKYIPDFNDGNKITLHNLLSHTSGIVDYQSVGLYRMKSQDINLKNVINLIKDQPLHFNPGEKFEYTNSGYLLLTYVIEKVSGLSYDKYLDKYIFKPIGMNNTGDCIQNGKFMLKTTGYTGFLDINPVYDSDIKLGYGFGAWKLYSTTGDLYKWDRALYTDKLLKENNLKKMFTGYAKMYSGYSYGYGFEIGSTTYGKEIMHSGSTISFTSVISRFVDKDLTIVVLANSQNYNVYFLKEALKNIVFGNNYEMPKPLPQVAKIDKGVYKNYIGKYNLSTGGKIDITTDGNHLYAQFEGMDLVKLEIQPESKTTFFCREIDQKLSFDFDKDNKVIGFSLLRDKNDFIALKQNENSAITTTIVIDQSILDSYVGDYKDDNDLTMTISSNNGHLYAQSAVQDKLEIYPETETKFYYKILAKEIDFKKKLDGKVDSFTAKQLGSEVKFIKVK